MRDDTEIRPGESPTYLDALNRIKIEMDADRKKREEEEEKV